MIIQIRVSIDVPPENELTYTITTERIIEAINAAIVKEYPSIRLDKHPSPITVTMSKINDLKDMA